MTHLKNLMADFEPLYKEKARHIAEIIKLIQKKTEHINTSNTDKAWTMFDEEHFRFKIKYHAGLLVTCDTQMKAISDQLKKDRKDASDLFFEMEKSQQYTDEDTQKILENLEGILEKEDWSRLYSVLQKKEVDPTVIHTAFIKRAFTELKEETLFTLPPEALRVRFVYEDAPALAIQNGAILYWAYDEAEGSEDAIDPHTLIFNEKTSQMTPVGIGLTDSDGFMIQSIPLNQKETGFFFDRKQNRIIVNHHIDPEEIGKIRKRFEKEDEKAMERAIQRIEKPDHDSCAGNPELMIKDEASVFSDKRKDEVKKLTIGAALKLGKTTEMEQKILENFVCCGFSEEGQKAINDLPLFKTSLSESKTQKPVMGQHYFISGRRYGFMVFPVNRGSFATKDLTTLSKIEVEKCTSQKGRYPLPENVVEPDVPQRAAWKGLLPTEDKIPKEEYVTIRLHSTLPEWDRRISIVLKDLLFAQKTYGEMIKPHTENLFRLQKCRELIDWYIRFPYEEMEQGLIKKCQEVKKALHTIEEDIEKRVLEPKDEDDLYLKNANEFYAYAADKLWELLTSEAFYHEFKRYQKEAFGENPAEEERPGEKDGVTKPGPYMEAEPYWSHIFDTLSKAYSALVSTEKEDVAWYGSVQGYVRELVNEVTSGLDLGMGDEVAEGLGRLEDENVFNEVGNSLDPLRGRFENNIVEKHIKEKESTPPDVAELPKFNLLDQLPKLYLKGASLFHNLPGPSSTAQHLMDAYFKHISIWTAINSKGSQSAHIKLNFAVMKLYGVLPKGTKYDEAKFGIQWLLRDCGRPQKKLIKKDKLVSLSVKHDASTLRKRHRPFEANKNLNELMFNLSKTIKEENAYSEALYHARGHFKYKGVIQIYNLMLLIEAWGNLPKNEAMNLSESLEYAASVVATMGDSFYKGINTLEFARKIAAGYREGVVTASLAKLTLPVGKMADFTEAKLLPNLKFSDIADTLGTGLCFISGSLALLKSYEEFQKGRGKESLLRLAEGAGCFTLATGHLLGQTTSKLTQKVSQRLLQKEIAKRVALCILPGASIAVSIITLYDIYRTVVHFLKAPLYHVFDGYWNGFEKSTFSYYHLASIKAEDEDQDFFPNDAEAKFVAIRKGHTKALYFNPSYASGDTEEAYQAVNRLMNDVTKNGFLSWRAVIPMVNAGYGVDAIKDFIKIVATPKDMENFIPIKDGFQKGREELFDNYQVRERLNARGIIDFYNIISNPYRAQEQFESGKTYGEVADELSKGVFNPTKETPELLEAQKAYDGNNHSILKKQYKTELSDHLEMVIDNELFKKPDTITEEEFKEHLKEKLKFHYPKIRYDLICSGWFVDHLDKK